jgi:hypothetical protein
VKNYAQYEDDPELVRGRLRRTTSGDWYVFEVLAADGTLAIGVARGAPDRSLVLVVYEGLSEAVAHEAADGLTRWKHSSGGSTFVF